MAAPVGIPPPVGQLRLTSAPGTGEPVPASVATPVARSLGVDVSGVRVHSDHTAARMARALGARAFAYGNRVFLGRGERATNLGVMAHELAHVVQQRGAARLQTYRGAGGDRFETEAQRASAAVVSGERFAVRERTTPTVQRLGLSDALDYFADKAHHIPGFRMFTIVLGVNPINMSRVDRSAANVMRAVIEFMPGGHLITEALNNHGIFERAGGWVEQQLASLAMTGSAIRSAVNRFLDSLSWSDIFDLGGVWERAKRIFTEPIDRIKAFLGGLVDGIVEMVKEVILRPLASLAEGTRGYPLLKAVLGKDPITGDDYPRTADTLIGGFMTLIGQEEVWNNIKRANAVSRAWAWFQGALEGVLAFVRAIPETFMSALRALTIGDIVVITRAFSAVGRVFAGFVGSFISWAGQQVMKLLEIIFEVLAPAVMPYLRKAMGAFRQIIQNPVGFVGNLVRAGVQGFRQFAGRFLDHLRAALIGWLTGTLGGTGVYIPQGFNLREIVKFALSVLGLTWQSIRGKIVRVIGEPAVRALETGFDLVVTLVRQGPAAAWDKIREGVSNLRQMVIDQVMEFVKSRIVQAAITRILTSLNPAGAFIQAILAIYNTVMFVVERLRQIGQVVASFVDSISAIASGAVGAAANRVEQTMAGLLTLVVSFLARFAGLGRVSDHVLAMIRRIRAPIDRALDRVVAWIVGLARRAGRFIAQAGVPADPIQRLRLGRQAALAAVNRLAGRPVGRAVLDPILAAIRTRYGFQRLEPVSRRGRWHVVGRINPGFDDESAASEGAGETAELTAESVFEAVKSQMALKGPPETRVSESSLSYSEKVFEHLIARSPASEVRKDQVRRGVATQIAAATRGTDSHAVYLALRQAAGMVNSLYPATRTSVVHHEQEVAEYPNTFVETRTGRMYVPRSVRRQIDQRVAAASGLNAAQKKALKEELIALVKQQLFDMERTAYESPMPEIDLIALPERVHTQLHRRRKAGP